VRRGLSDAERQRLVDLVAQVTRDGLSRVAPAQLEAGWERLDQALADGRYPSVPIVRPNVTPWYFRGIVFVSMLLVAGIATDFMQYQREMAPLAPLHFVLEGTSVGTEQSIEAPATAPAQLVFSDRSRLSLAPRAKIAVVSMDSQGARVALARGDLEVSVTHREDSSWRFEAGPFTVVVRGTAFHLGYQAERGRLTLQMREGAVEVRGPSQDRRLTLRAGESLELFATPATAEEAGPPAVPAELAMLEPPTPAAPATGPAAAEAQPAPAAGHPWSHRTRSKRGESAADRQPDDSWARLIARGQFSTVVADAEARGLGIVLAQASAAELTSLADAARYTLRYDVARDALLRVRARFPGTSPSREAAFFLGRLAEVGPSSSAKAALGWYETYLRESAQGAYAGEALGREIALFAQSDRERARTVARQYLARFPQGSQAELARSLLQSAGE
jgi:ferric-dicitrate binding protein FerR (iron transport regulator)